jgi:hypothetical protein
MLASYIDDPNRVSYGVAPSVIRQTAAGGNESNDADRRPEYAVITKEKKGGQGLRPSLLAAIPWQ